MTALDVRSPGFKWLPFAKNRLNQIRDLAALMGTPVYAQVMKPDSGTLIRINTVFGMDRIRIESGQPWYFFAVDYDPGTSGSRLTHISTGIVQLETLQRVDIGSEPFTFFGPARALGRSSAAVIRPATGIIFIDGLGVITDTADPAALFAPGGTIYTWAPLVAGTSGSASAWIYVAADTVSRALMFSDGNVIEQGQFHSPGSDGVTLARVGTAIAGTQAYYWGRFTAGGFGGTLGIYRASPDYPRAGDGSVSGPIAPVSVLSTSVVAAADIFVFRDFNEPKFATNDYDLIAVVTKSYFENPAKDPIPGVIEIYIGSQLVWSSPGTATLARIGADANTDDVWPLAVVGDANQFFVVLSNLGGALVADDLGRYGVDVGILLKALTFTRQSDGTYAIATATYSRQAVDMTATAVATPTGFQIFAGFVSLSGSPGTEFGWLSSTLVWQSAYSNASAIRLTPSSLAHNYPADRPLFITAVAMPFGAVAAFLLPNQLSTIFFSRSDAAPATTVTHSGTHSNEDFPYLVATDTVLALTVFVSGTNLIVGSDGRTVTYTDGLTFSGYVLDEGTRAAHALEWAVSGTDRGVWRRGIDTGVRERYPDTIPSANSIGNLYVAAPSEHHRMRLLSQWAAADRG